MSGWEESKRLRIRRPDRCATCGKDLPAGTVAVWYPGPRLVRCLDSGVAPGLLTPGISVVPAVTPVGELPDPERELDHPPFHLGVAGRSASREHRRRRKQREDRAREKMGVIGVGLVKLAGDPQSTRAWERGAEGEALVGRRLEKYLAGSGVKLIHDRAVRGRGGMNIDHIAVGPGGVTVIDTKSKIDQKPAHLQRILTLGPDVPVLINPSNHDLNPLSHSAGSS